MKQLVKSLFFDLHLFDLYVLGALFEWVEGVLRYHQTLTQKVNPLKNKVKQTSISIGLLKTSC